MHIKQIVLFSLLSAVMFSQSPEKAVKKLGKNPVFFIDSVRVDRNEFRNFDNNETSLVSIYNDFEAISLFGDDGKDGIVYVETIKFSKNRYWKFFKSKSAEYLILVPNSENDSNVQYILNKNVLVDNFEGALATIDNSTFEKLIILSKQELHKQFNITDKEFGILIISKTPKNLYNGKQKF